MAKRPSILVISELIQKYLNSDYDKIIAVFENMDQILAGTGLTLTVDFSEEGYTETTLGDFLKRLAINVQLNTTAMGSVSELAEAVATANDTLGTLAVSLVNDLDTHTNEVNAQIAALTSAIQDTLNDITIVGEVISINGKTGNVTLNPDDLDDAGTSHKFVSQAQVNKIDFITVTEAVDLDALAEAVDDLSGITGITVEQAADIEANNLKETNVPTSLSIGTHNTVSLAITSDGSADDVILPAATDELAGLMSVTDKIKLDDMVALDSGEVAKLSGIEEGATNNGVFGKSFITEDAGSTQTNSTTTFEEGVACSIPAEAPIGLYLCQVSFQVSIDAATSGYESRLLHNTVEVRSPNRVMPLLTDNDLDKTHTFKIYHNVGLGEEDEPEISDLSFEFKRIGDAAEVSLVDLSISVWHVQSLD